MRAEFLSEGEFLKLHSPSTARPVRHGPKWISSFFALLLSTGVSHAAVIDIVWDDTGRFATTAAAAAGKFAEVCGKLEAGRVVDWNYQASGDVDFNIHYHVGDKVEYPQKRSAVSSLNGRLDVTSEQAYCWMWKNNQSAPVSIELRLQRK